MAAISTLMAGLTLAGGVSQSRAINAMGDYQKSIFDTNARFSDLRAEDAIKRGDKEAQNVQKQAKRLIGTQRATLAAQGIELDEGTALQIQEDTAELGAADAMTVRNNAWREAWGFRAQALDFRSQGKMAKLGARNRAASTLLNAGMQSAQYLNSNDNSSYLRMAASAGGGA